jgi:hypothetical protein
MREGAHALPRPRLRRPPRIAGSALPASAVACGAAPGNSLARQLSHLTSNECSVTSQDHANLGTRRPRPIAAPLDRSAELFGVELATVREAAAKVEPYLRADGTKVWSLMQLERRFRPEAFGPHRPGGYITRRRAATADT